MLWAYIMNSKQTTIEQLRAYAYEEDWGSLYYEFRKSYVGYLNGGSERNLVLENYIIKVVKDTGLIPENMWSKGYEGANALSALRLKLPCMSFEVSSEGHTLLKSIRPLLELQDKCVSLSEWGQDSILSENLSPISGRNINAISLTYDSCGSYLSVALKTSKHARINEMMALINFRMDELFVTVAKKNKEPVQEAIERLKDIGCFPYTLNIDYNLQ